MSVRTKKFDALYRKNTEQDQTRQHDRIQQDYEESDLMTAQRSKVLSSANGLDLDLLNQKAVMGTLGDYKMLTTNHRHTIPSKEYE